MDIQKNNKMMRNQKVTPESVDQTLFDTFSALGYDGTSMEILASATGLKKASLYHRFPKGKKEMALHVLDNAEHYLEENLVKTAADTTMKPALRLKNAIETINEIYNGGASNCLLRTLSVGTDSQYFKEAINKCFKHISDGFELIAIDLGIEPETAKLKARDINLLIQGSLVMAGATSDRSYFKNTLAKIPDFLTAR
jgi:TetR/AcrR family transcriptional repressor of lmrAB and yxaGH operons